ncbi:MAG: hypothetical protein ABJE95_26405 [Byssovorax sp.]
MLPLSLLACGTGTGDIPSPGCQSVQLSNVIDLATTPAGDGYTRQCLPRALSHDTTTGAAACAAFYGRAASGTCDCAAADGFKAVSADHKAGVDQLFGSLSPGCVCEIEQITGAALKACVQQVTSPLDAMGNELNGYCYVAGDNATNPELIKDCAVNEKRLLRFLGRSASRQAGDLGIAYLCDTDVCADPTE